MATLQFGTLIQRVLTVVSAGGTTTLVNNTERNIEVTGTMAQTIKLPNATTCKVGREFYIANRSSNSVTVNYNDNSLAVTIDPNTERLLYITSISTSNGTWDISTGSGGSGSGGGAPNLIVDGLSKNDSDFEGGTTGDWAGFIDPAQTTPTDGTGGGTPANISFAASGSTPLEGNFSALWSKTGSVNAQGGGFSLSSIPVPFYLRGQNLSCGFWYTIASGTYTSGDIQIWMYDQTNNVLIVGDVQSLTSTVTGVAQKFVMNIPTSVNAADLRFIIFQSSTTTNNYTIEFDKFFVSPIETIQGSAEGDWTPYTPTFISLGVVSNVNFQWRRQGVDMLIKGYVQLGTTSSEASFTLPTGYTVRTSFRDGSNLRQEFGVWYQWASGPLYIYNNDGIAGVLTNHPGFDDRVDFQARVHTGQFFNDNASTFSSSGNWFYVDARIPIDQWSPQVVLSNSRVQYASNTGMGDVSDTTSFTNDQNGSPIPTTNYSTSRLKIIRFQTPVAPTDSLVLQIQNAGGAWINLAGDTHDSTSTSLIKGYNGDVGYGVAVYIQINSTDFDVIFGQYQEPPTSNWSGANTSRWRVVKYSNAVPVESAGFSGPVYAKYHWTTSSTTPSFASNAVLIIDYDTVDDDVGPFGPNVTTGSNWKFTAPVSGIYLVTADLELNSNPDIDSNIRVHVNGILARQIWIKSAAGSPGPANTGNIVSKMARIKLNVGDFLDFRIFQRNTGGALGVNDNGSNNFTINTCEIALIPYSR